MCRSVSTNYLRSSSVTALSPILLGFALTAGASDDVAEVRGRCVGQALATEAIAESIRSGGVWEAESNIKLFDFVSTPAAADWDASFTVERINL